MATVNELYTTVDAKTVSHQVIIANQPVGRVLGITWSFNIGTVPTATIRVPYPAPTIAEYFADVYVNVGFNGVMERVFTGKVLNVSNSAKEVTIECAGLSMFLERPNEGVAIGIDSKTNIVAIAEVFAAAGIDYFTNTIPSWTMGTNNPSVLEFQTFAEAITKIAEIDGGRWAEMPTGQIRVAVYDPIASPSAARTYFSMTLTALAEAYPSDLTAADGRPRIRTVRRIEKVQDTKNRIHVRGATVTEEIAPGVESSHDIEKTQSSDSPWVKAPDGSQAFNDMVFSNDLIDTFDKADEVALRLLALHSRKKEELALQVEGDPLRRLGESIRVEDASYTGLTDRWFLEGYRTTLTQTSFITSLKLRGTGTSLDIDPVAAFTYKAVWIVIDDDLYVIVTLDGTPSFDPDGSIASYAWSDNQAPEVATGATAVLNICKKTFGVGGDIVPEWQVTLTVTDADGNTDAITQIIDLTLCDDPPLPNVVAPSLFSALGNNYAGSADAGVSWNDQAGTDVISVVADPVNEGQAIFGRADGGIYSTEDTVFSAPSNVLAAVGSPMVSLAWDDIDFDIVWALTEDGRVYQSTNRGSSWALYQNLRTVLALPNLKAAKIQAIGGALLVCGGEGNGEPLIAIDQFKNNNWNKSNIGGELRDDLDTGSILSPIVTGTYTGSLSDVSVVVGFRPDAIIISSSDGIEGSTIVFRDMIRPNDEVFRFDTGGLVLTQLSSFDASGFTVIGNAGFVNVNGETYHYIAFRNVAGVCRIGTYTGNGTSQDISALGLDPDLAIIRGEISGGTSGAVVRTNTMPHAIAMSQFVYDGANGCTLGVDSFSVGSYRAINEAASIFWYIAMENTADLIATGSYSGDGADDRAIPSVGFDPNVVMLWGFVIPPPTAFGHWRSDTMPADPGLSAARFLRSSAQNNVIQSLGANSFEVGSDDSANNGSETYHWIALRAVAGLGVVPADLYIADCAFNAGLNLWELAIILNSATFEPAVYFTTELLGDGSQWKRATGLPSKTRGVWIAPDLLADQFVFAYADQAIYTGDVAAGVLAAAVAAATLDGGDAPNHGFWMGQFIPGLGSVYIISSESVAPDGDIYLSCDRFITVGKVRPAAGFDAMPANAIAEMTTLGAVPRCPELYVQEDSNAAGLARLDFNVYTDLGSSPVADNHWHLIFLNGVAYRIDGVVSGPTIGGMHGGLWRADDIDSNNWVEVIESNSLSNRGTRAVTIAADGVLWAGDYVNGTADPGDELRIYRSDDNGLTWQQVITGFEGLGADAHRVLDIACDPLNANNICMTVVKSTTVKAVIYSTDGGATWARATGMGSGNFNNGMYITFADAHRIVGSWRDSVEVSDDLGVTWASKLTLSGKIGTPWMIRNPFNRQQLAACWTDSGVGNEYFEVYISRNNGEDWSLLIDYTTLLALGWPSVRDCWSGTFLEDGSLVIASRQDEVVWRNANPFGVPPPTWQDWSYNLDSVILRIGGQGLASKRIELEP